MLGRALLGSHYQTSYIFYIRDKKPNRAPLPYLGIIRDCGIRKEVRDAFYRSGLT